MSKNRFAELAISSLKSNLLSQPNLFLIINDDSHNHLQNQNRFYEYSSPWLSLKNEWRTLTLKQAQLTHSKPNSHNTHSNDEAQAIEAAIERQEVDWLIKVFNKLFVHQNVELIRGDSEPEYIPAQNNQPARIEFAHGFFASALHEISHWCIAGKKRRTLLDFGYWYAADGRNEAQQNAFEKVEIKPQAIECLFTLMCAKKFRVSQDNLFADFDTSKSTFETDVFKQAEVYIDSPATLPADARTLLTALAYLCTDDFA